MPDARRAHVEIPDVGGVALNLPLPVSGEGAPVVEVWARGHGRVIWMPPGGSP